jgi:hypothetical protein
LAGKKPGKWAWLRGKYPELSEEPEYEDVVAASRRRYEGRTLAELAACLNTLEEIKEIQERYVSSTNADIAAVEQLMQKRFDVEQTESIRVGGYAFAPKAEPVASVEDAVAWLEHVRETQPEILTVHYQTMQSIVKQALEANEALPPGVKINVRTTISRRKGQ